MTTLAKAAWLRVSHCEECQAPIFQRMTARGGNPDPKFKPFHSIHSKYGKCQSNKTPSSPTTDPKC